MSGESKAIQINGRQRARWSLRAIMSWARTPQLCGHEDGRSGNQLGTQDERFSMDRRHHFPKVGTALRIDTLPYRSASVTFPLINSHYIGPPGMPYSAPSPVESTVSRVLQQIGPDSRQEAKSKAIPS